MNLIARSLNDQVLWLRNHPAIIAWFVGSDMIPRPELEKRYKAYLSQIDDRPYIGAAKELTSTVTGPTGMKWKDRMIMLLLIIGIRKKHRAEHLDLIQRRELVHNYL